MEDEETSKRTCARWKWHVNWPVAADADNHCSMLVINACPNAIGKLSVWRKTSLAPAFSFSAVTANYLSLLLFALSVA